MTYTKTELQEVLVQLEAAYAETQRIGYVASRILYGSTGNVLENVRNAVHAVDKARESIKYLIDVETWGGR